MVGRQAAFLESSVPARAAPAAASLEEFTYRPEMDWQEGLGRWLPRLDRVHQVTAAQHRSLLDEPWATTWAGAELYR